MTAQETQKLQEQQDYYQQQLQHKQQEYDQQQQQQQTQILPAKESNITITTTKMELSENFYIDNRRKQNVKIQVKLTPDGVYLRRETEQDDHINEQLIRIDDIIGTRCGPRLKKRQRGGLNSCKRIQDPDIDDESNNRDAVSHNGSSNASSDGGHGGHRHGGQSDTSAYLYIYAYIRKEKPLRRVQTLRILRFRTYNRYEENLKTAERWHQAIRQHKGKDKPNTAGKQLLILLNPKSGSGKGRELFQKQVAPLLREAEAQYDLQITTHSHFAQEFVRSRKDLLERYSGILVASGDGLFYEVLNGLMERMDWRRACHELPLGIIPCGSGNGLAKSIAHHCNEPYEPKPILNATLTCVSGKSTPMDVVRVELAKRDQHFVMYSFLSIGWGLIADIDIESERLRSIGPQRFTLWAIKRLITLRTYKGKLYYLPATHEAKVSPTLTPTSLPSDKPNSDKPNDNNIKSDIQTSHTSTQAQAHAQAQGRAQTESFNEYHDLPEEAEEVFDDTTTTASCSEQQSNIDFDQFADALSLDLQQQEQLQLPQTDSWHSTISRRTAYYSLGPQSSMRSNRSRCMNMTNRIENANAEFAERVPTGSIPPLKMPLENIDGWCCEEDDYVMVHAAYTTHLASDCFFVPDSRLNDGIIYMVVIRAGVGRSQLLNFLLGMSTGTHLPTTDDPFIRVIPVRAFRIEPSGQHGILTVDGERVEYGPIQAEIFPGMVNVMASNGK